MDLGKLRELLEMELSSTELTLLDDDFYEEFDSLIKALKLRAESSKERGEEVDEQLYLAELSVAEKLVKEILKIRLHKIVDMAFEGRPFNLISDEKKLFSILMAFIHREEIPAFEEEVSIEETKEVEVTSDRRIFSAYILLQDIPKVLDERLREYGPFKAGDLVTLPRTVGHILVQREAAKRISISY
ncbi:hypothetical protein K1720_05920 [Thermococcus argininiproducens]|uniref:Gins51 C-terminal domain-containing protein n=1 Tax=Thermococcus argininiproducens TaxID=2866384 RepID=A0A9E7M7Y0_9EURY|nr:hypothetical protein [Thermococcus argininiproducens]USG99086.1 hypothetical protein K1720_05920 [Thermococcus argininiproducens]